MNTSELIGLTARQAVAGLKCGDFTPVELIEAAMARIEQVDGQVNALPIHCYERAFEQAEKLDTAAFRDPARGLFGLPIAVKDYNDVGAVRTTYGSPLYADHIAARSDATVAHLERNGAIPIAKANVPEWAGGHTFNPLFGITRNPWNTDLSAGGSSGGSAVAVATGMAWLATGNDLGGSLRTPAGFNGVVGLRPSPGRVPRGSRLQAFDTLWVEGPMARNVGDVALMLDAAAGYEACDPLSFDDPTSFSAALIPEPAPLRIAFSADLGIVPVAREVAQVCERAVRRFAGDGVEVSDEIPDFSGVLEAFQTLRAVLLGTMMGPLLETHRDRIAADIVRNIERGFSLSPQQVFSAERTRWQLYHKMAAFFEHHDFLLCPSASIEPFPVQQRYVEEIDGHPCETYIDWFSITFALTMTACPVIVVPCGLTAAGLPVGLQIVGKPRGEYALLAAAHHFEQLLGFCGQLPIDPRPPRPRPE